MKPGVYYYDMQTLAYRVMLENLKERTGILKGDVDEMIQNLEVYLCLMASDTLWVSIRTT